MNLSLLGYHLYQQSSRITHVQQLASSASAWLSHILEKDQKLQAHRRSNEILQYSRLYWQGIWLREGSNHIPPRKSAKKEF